MSLIPFLPPVASAWLYICVSNLDRSIGTRCTLLIGFRMWAKRKWDAQKQIVLFFASNPIDSLGQGNKLARVSETVGMLCQFEVKRFLLVTNNPRSEFLHCFSFTRGVHPFSSPSKTLIDSRAGPMNISHSVLHYCILKAVSSCWVDRNLISFHLLWARARERAVSAMGFRSCNKNYSVSEVKRRDCVPVGTSCFGFTGGKKV